MSIEQVGYARLLLDNFIKYCAERKIQYFPQVPWDVRNLEDVLEYYDKSFLDELLKDYATHTSDPTINHFCNNIQKIAKTHAQNVKSTEEFQEKMARTKRKMSK